MARPNEIATFLSVWDHEAESTIRLLESLPDGRYEFRADPKGRSIGEIAWHLSEIDGCLSFGVAERRFDLADDLPELKRPRELEALAPGYRRVHELAVERIRSLEPEALDEQVTFFDGTPMTIRDVLWVALLHHLIHHRGQLVLLCRLAGGVPPGIYGPNREEMEKIREAMKAGKG
ncbi:MAG TPA: DinB family protein [Acidobacteriota bacterium]|nr:DinB family protein [Acidobacteriota bacterium]